MAYFNQSAEDSQLNRFDASLVTQESLSSIIKSEFSFLANQKFYEIEAAEVVKVLTNEEDLPTIDGTTLPDYEYYGAIKARQFTSEQDVDEKNLPWRFPISPSNLKMPLIGETVLCVEYLNEPYYCDVVNRLKNPNINVRDFGLSSLGTEEQDTNIRLDYYKKIEETLGNVSSPTPESESREFDSEKIFTPIKIQNTKLNPGDTLLQGRFGNVIRFSSDQKNSEFSSNIKISTGQLHNETDLNILQKIEESPNAIVEQNINTDASSLYFTENETIDLSVDLISKVAPGRILSNREFFSGAQIIGNSDNVVLNARVNDVHLFGNQNVNLTAGDRVNLEAPIINLGDRTASQRLVKGDIFIEVFKTLLISLKVFANRLTDVTAPNPNNSILDLEMAATKLREQIDNGVLPFLEDTLSNRNFTS